MKAIEEKNKQKEKEVVARKERLEEQRLKALNDAEHAAREAMNVASSSEKQGLRYF